MAQGLQCWDASGRLIVDIGDYNMRYMGSVNLMYRLVVLHHGA